MVKMFAESVLELTDPHSPASYRHRTLSTTAKALELREQISEVKSRIVPTPVLNPMIAEYAESVSSDPIVSEILLKKVIPQRSLLFAEQDSLERMTGALRIFAEAIESNYIEFAEELILKLCLSTKREKVKLRQCTDLYVSHLIGLGISREYLYITALREFSSVEVMDDGISNLRKFFDVSSGGNQSYHFAFNMQKEACKFLSGIFPIVTANNLDELPPYFKYSMRGVQDIEETGPFVVVSDFPGRDPFTSARGFRTILDMVQAFLFVFPDGTKWKAPQTGCAYDPLSGAVYRVPMNEFVNEGAQVKDKRSHSLLISKMTKFTFERLNARGIKSGRKIMSALQAASAASRIRENDVRLLSIWSAFEALLPIPMKDGEITVRINHFAKYLAPLASARYVRNLFYNMYSDLNTHYRKQVNLFLDDNCSGKSRFQKFLSVFFLDQAKRMEFTSIFADSELLKYRAHDLHKLASDPIALQKRVQDHERRVFWQLHRIYRVRNMIVHSAQPARFTPHLTENAFGYFKALIACLVEVGERVEVTDSDALLDLCIAMCEEHKEKLGSMKDKSARDFMDFAAKGPFGS